jgi:hypothetical protein
MSALPVQQADPAVAEICGEKSGTPGALHAFAIDVRSASLPGERHAPIVLALLGAPAAAASPAPARVLIGWLRLSAAIAAPLGRGWLRGRTGPPRGLRRQLRGVYVDLSGTVQLLVDELDDDLADKLGDGAAQLVSDKLLERSLGRRGHGWSVLARLPDQRTSVRTRIATKTLWELWTAIPIHALRYRFVG